MKNSNDKRWGRKLIFTISIIINLCGLFLPGKYDLEYYVEKSASDTDTPMISSVEFKSKVDSWTYEGDNKESSIIVPYERMHIPFE